MLWPAGVRSDQLSFAYCTTNGTAALVTVRLDEAVSWLNKAQRLNPRYKASKRMLIAALALTGELDRARQHACEFMAWEPGSACRLFAKWYPLQSPHVERVLEGLGLAGIPA